MTNPGYIPGPEFTAHDIILDDGRHTMPGGPLITEGGWYKAALSLLDAEFSPGERAQTTVADLGCLEGGYATGFARAGYQATGVEARAANIQKCRWVQAYVKLPNLQFVHDDARNLPAYGPFDAVFCCGLLYHLDYPAAFLRMLGQQTRRLLIVQTHYSMSCQDTTADGYKGHWWPDNPGEHDLWGSWTNQMSFWLGRDELIHAMRDAGFTDVRPVEDGTTAEDRGMFAGVRR